MCPTTASSPFFLWVVQGWGWWSSFCCAMHQDEGERGEVPSPGGGAGVLLFPVTGAAELALRADRGEAADREGPQGTTHVCHVSRSRTSFSDHPPSHLFPAPPRFSYPLASHLAKLKLSWPKLYELFSVAKLLLILSFISNFYCIFFLKLRTTHPILGIDCLYLKFISDEKVASCSCSASATCIGINSCAEMPSLIPHGSYNESADVKRKFRVMENS